MAEVHALSIRVGKRPDGSGWVAICECGYTTTPFASKGLLAEHVKATWPAHIEAAHMLGDDDHHEVEMAAGIMAATGTLDPHLGPCPQCGERELRAESRVEWRPMSEVCEMFGVTPAEVRASGAKVSGLGRVKCGVPYVTCMACGLDADGSREAFL